MPREPMIAGEPLANWERTMGRFDDACTVAGLEMRGLVVSRDSSNANEWLGACSVMPFDPFLGINPDGTRVTIAQHRARQEGRG